MQTLIENVNAMWQESSKEKRKELLQTLGFNESWSETESINEMRERGGGWVAKSLLKLYEDSYC